MIPQSGLMTSGGIRPCKREPEIVSTEEKVRALCAEIKSPDPAQAERILSRLETRLGHLRLLAAQMAAAQRIALPIARIKGLALFAVEQPDSPHLPEGVSHFLNPHSAGQKLVEQHDVKVAVINLGSPDALATGTASRQILQQRWKTNGLSPAELAWESLYAGIRTAYSMKGKGTDVFGTNCFGEITGTPEHLEALAQTSAWDVSAMTGFILASAHLQTPVIVSGASGTLAARLALQLSAPVRAYLILAQPDAANTLAIKPLFDLQIPDTLAIITALGLCESAARICQAMPISPE